MTATPKDSGSSKSPSILVIDDEPMVTRALGRVLRREGLEVMELNDPTKVEEYILYSDIKLVITDLKMPNRTGIDVLKLFRNSRPEIPVLMLTGHGTIESAVETTKLGAAEFLSKPIDNESLLAAVKKHLFVDERIPKNIRNLVSRKIYGRTKGDLEESRLLLDREIVSTDSIPEGFVEVDFNIAVPGEKVPFAIYVQIFNKKSQRYFLRKMSAAGDVFSGGLRNMLFRRKLATIFIREKDYRAYLKYYSELKNTQKFKQWKVREDKKLVLYGKAVEAVTRILSQPMDDHSINDAVNMVDDLFRKMVKEPDLYGDMFKLFKQDSNIFNHSANVCLLTTAFGLYLKFEQQTINILGLGALFHDLGMNAIDKGILDKTSPLTQDEWKLIKTHPEKGEAQLKKSLIFPLQAKRIVLEHHEKVDGSGYPRGLKGRQVSNMTRLLRIVDSFDSLTTEKPYRGAFSPANALKTIFLEEKDPGMQNLIKKFILFLGGKKD